MGLTAEILAFHGWGFDRNAWSVWPPYLASSWRLQAFDRGYYGKPYDPVFSDPNARKIIFTHSYGLHLCPQQQLESCDLLVVFSGFLHFHSETLRLQGKSRLILQRMQKQFALEPGAVMRRFMQRCYAPARYEDHLNREFDRDRLAEDLRLLGHSRMAAATLEKARRVIVLHGSEDRIVPSSQGRALFDTLQPQARYHEIEGAGHALPFSHPQQCWAILEPVLRLF
ncbi:MAG: alpha/beta hydrolase [Nitrococcus mobilis]|nr:alpha/beta hydrolase [Nitrococcus mobilis]